MKKIQLPDNKKFAFTIIDDTDDSFLENTKPIYDLLYSHGIFITKTVWVYPPRDKESKGHSLQHKGYREFIVDLKNKGFEIGLHNIGSGEYFREEIVRGLEEYKEYLGEYPKIHINHAYNPDSIYGGYKRFGFLFSYLLKKLYPIYAGNYQGEVHGSPHFWGDLHKKHIKYNRNYETDRMNTIKFNPYMPYSDKGKQACSNYWFSSTFSPNQQMFNRIVTRESIDELEAEGGICILNTHLGYYMRNGKIDKGFVEKIKYLSQKNSGWYVPVSTVLDYLMENRAGNTAISGMARFRLEFLYLLIRYKYRKIIKIDDYSFKDTA